MEIAGAPDARRRAQALLEEVGLTGRAHHYPVAAVGRRAAARRARARAGQRPADRAGRRADRQSRHRQRPSHHGAAARASIARAARRSCWSRTTPSWRRWPTRGWSCATAASSSTYESGARMRFVLRMAVRETRASWRRLLFFFICIAVGVAAIVALRSVIQSVREVFGREARALIAADVVIDTNRDWTPAARGADRPPAGGGRRDARTETIETPTMVRPADESRTVARMVELRAVQARVSALRHASCSRADSPTRTRCSQNHGALVRPELLTALGLQVGDADRHRHRRRSRSAASITSEPGRRDRRQFSLGPRVFIDFADVPSTGLLGFGSRADAAAAGQGARGSDRRAGRRRCAPTSRTSSSTSRSYRSNEDRDRPRLRSRRELPEPGRPGHRDPRRHRRVERHARVHPAEDPQHRGAEVRRRAQPRRSSPSTSCRC